MVIVDVLLALNLLVLSVCAVRGPARSRTRQSRVRFLDYGPSGVEASGSSEAVILPFRRPPTSNELSRALALHPSAQDCDPCGG
jgi:hypothetical protein